MLAAMPWNPALWWIARRLRLAVEVDCDGRVLAGERWDTHTYGSLLLAVGGRENRCSHGMAAFSKPLSTLEHRILRMTDRERGPRWIKRGILLAEVTAALMGAWVLPTPPPLGAWAVYNFSPRSFVRAIVQCRDTSRNPDTHQEVVKRSTSAVFTQLPFSYKVNPQTVVFFGYSDNRDAFTEQDYARVPLTQSDRTLCLKLGYAFRP